MNEQKLEELIEALEINVDVDWDFNETTPQEEFAALAKMAKALRK